MTIPNIDDVEAVAILKTSLVLCQMIVTRSQTYQIVVQVLSVALRRPEMRMVLKVVTAGYGSQREPCYETAGWQVRTGPHSYKRMQNQ